MEPRKIRASIVCPSSHMKYLFGPVNSRRLGLSQGIDLIPAGVCNFNCIYCEVSKKKELTPIRREYSPTQAIIAEIDSIFSNTELANSIDVFTITASGEPTLHSGLQKVIEAIKKKTTKPITVLTNGGMLHIAEVRKSLANADIVAPSLDTVTARTFQKINRPTPCSNIDKIIAGIAQFKTEFRGKLWLEILLVKGVNDSQEDIEALKKTIKLINPDKIQLNTVARPPIESFAKPLTAHDLQKVTDKLDCEVEIIANFNSSGKKTAEKIKKCDIIELLRRRPGTTTDICQALRSELPIIESHLQQLAQEGVLKTTRHSAQDYWIIRKI